MDRARHIRNYELHSWAGITLGLVVYLICFSGSFAMFHVEIKTWEDPAKRIAISDEPAEINGVFLTWLEEATDGAEVENLNFNFPLTHRPFYSANVRFHDENDEHVTKRQRWDPNTAEPINQSWRKGGLSEWIVDFHRDLMWPSFLGGRTIGRSLVGIVGIVLMLAILSGIVAHTKIREEAYSMRLKRSQRLKWQDSHKVVGLWGLPFFGMIAFTGAYLGVIVIIIQVVTLIPFKGDTTRLAELLIEPPVEASGQHVEMISLDDLRNMQHPQSGNLPNSVNMRNYGDAVAEFSLQYPGGETLRRFEVLTISGATGAPIPSDSADQEYATLRVAEAMEPLHYGTYGGIWLKFLYFILGMGMAVVTALGSMMWIERRKHGNEGAKSLSFYNRIGYFNTGVIMGLPVATLSIFYLDKLYYGAEAARIIATGWTFFAVWACGLGYAWTRRDDYKTTRELLILTGLLAVGIFVLNGAVTGEWFFLHLITGHTAAAWVDAVMLIAGVATIATGLIAPSKRLDKQARREKGRSSSNLDNIEQATLPAE
ncbi:MAG: PepSY-associated TM helix domain-containing protein [Pseudomonadota bacterium]